MRMFNIQIYNIVLLTIVTMLYIISLWLIYFSFLFFNFYHVVLVSAIQQGESAIIIQIFPAFESLPPLPHPMLSHHHRAPDWL